MTDLTHCPYCGKTPEIQHKPHSFLQTVPSVFIACCHGLMIKEATQVYDWDKRKHVNVMKKAKESIIDKWNSRTGIDYKSLLEKYMLDVLLTEGVDFVNNITPEDQYTEEEVRELRRISGFHIDLNKL